MKRVIAWQLAEVMKQQHITKVDMARRLNTSRAQLDRLLDPDNDSVTLAMLTRGARAVGRSIKLELAKALQITSRSSGDGRGSKGTVGRVWYQKATEAMSSWRGR